MRTDVLHRRGEAPLCVFLDWPGCLRLHKSRQAEPGRTAASAATPLIHLPGAVGFPEALANFGTKMLSALSEAPSVDFSGPRRALWDRMQGDRSLRPSFYFVLTLPCDFLPKCERLLKLVYILVGLKVCACGNPA